MSTMQDSPPVTDDRDKSHWSTRYYLVDCPDLTWLMKTDGPDDRNDPAADAAVSCIVAEHGEHSLVRISPDDHARLDAESDEDDDL